MYQVTKHLSFCYGHRLLHYEGMCRHLHGHNGLIEVTLTSESLDARGMVRDFEEIKQKLKAWIDRTLDHTMLLNRKDPVVPVLQERGERLYLMDTNPTAEALAELIFNAAVSLGLPVAEVKLWETAQSWASYLPRPVDRTSGRGRRRATRAVPRRTRRPAAARPALRSISTAA